MTRCLNISLTNLYYWSKYCSNEEQWENNVNSKWLCGKHNLGKAYFQFNHGVYFDRNVYTHFLHPINVEKIDNVILKVKQRTYWNFLALNAFPFVWSSRLNWLLAFNFSLNCCCYREEVYFHAYILWLDLSITQTEIKY